MMNRNFRTQPGATILASMLAIATVSACGSDDAADPAGSDETGSARLAITQVPNDVSCLQVTVAGAAREVTRTFEVTPAQSAVLSLRGLPVGDVTFVENAFSETCATLTGDSIASWVSDAVPAELIAGVVADVHILLRRNGQAIVTSDFEYDDAGVGGAPTGTGGASTGGVSSTGGASTGGSGTCTPISMTNACANRECGTASNGCGSTYDCGSCSFDGCYSGYCSAAGYCVYGGACLVAGTPITMADGTQAPIERIRVGDQVLAYDVASGTTRPQRVSDTFHHAAIENHDGMVLVNGTIRATGNHPIYANGTWKRADALQSGEALIELGDGAVVETGAAIETLVMLPGSEDTFNIEVEGDHNYFAGGILVHNKPPPCL